MNNQYTYLLIYRKEETFVTIGIDRVKSEWRILGVDAEELSQYPGYASFLDDEGFQLPQLDISTTAPDGDYILAIKPGGTLNEGLDGLHWYRGVIERYGKVVPCCKMCGRASYEVTLSQHGRYFICSGCMNGGSYTEDDVRDLNEIVAFNISMWIVAAEYTRDLFLEHCRACGLMGVIPTKDEEQHIVAWRNRIQNFYDRTHQGRIMFSTS